MVRSQLVQSLASKMLASAWFRSACFGLVCFAICGLLSNEAVAQIGKPTALLQGKVLCDGSPVSGVQIAVIQGTERVANTKSTPSGTFTAILQPGKMYRVTYTSDAYAYREDTLRVPDATEFQKVPLDVTLMKLTNGLDLTPGVAIFDVGSSSISNDGAVALDRLVQIVRKNGIGLSVRVYPDYSITGKKDSKQQTLLDSRSMALRSYFVGQRVAGSSVDVTGVPSIATSAPVVETSSRHHRKAKKAVAPRVLITPNVRIDCRM